MKIRSLVCISLAGVFLFSPVFGGNDGKAAPRVEVIFSNPEKYRDAQDAYMGSDQGRDAILADLRAYIEQRVNHYVPEGQQLTIVFTDIDLAGEFEPWHGMQLHDVRIVKDIYAPRIDLEFKLTGDGGNILKEGKRELRDMAFMTRIDIRRNEPRVHEQNLLDEWLRAEFGRKS